MTAPASDGAGVKPGTALPWRVEQDTDLIWGACNPDDTTSYGMGYSIVEGRPAWSSWAKGKPDWDERTANARYIVTACNAYPALVEALAEAVLQIEYLHGRFQETGSGNGVIAKARAALSLADGGMER